eukprot:267252_1
MLNHCLVGWIGGCCIIAFVILLNSVYHLCFKDSSEWINGTYRNLTIIIMISLMLSSVIDFIHLCMKTPNKITIDETIISVSADFSYMFGSVLFYVLILLRIHVPFGLNRYVVGFLSMIICIHSVIFIITLLAEFIIQTGHFEFWEILNFALMINDAILNVSIFSIFIYKMKQTISDLTPSSNTAEQNINLISNVITKHSVLFGTSIIINQTYFSSNLYFDLQDDWGTIRNLCIIYSIRALENVMNILILWLILRINYEKYICVCKYCHICVAKCCFKRNDLQYVVNNPYHQLHDL